MQTFVVRFVTVILILTSSLISFASIRGEKGNKPLNDPGWPAGSAVVFNTGSRIAWWEGPPFGGGQFHSECQGNAVAFNDILNAFQKIDSKKKRLIVNDGVGSSFWLDPNQEHQGDPAIEIDWLFVVWQPDRWDMQKKLPAGVSSIRNDRSEDSPIPEIYLYVGGAIAWSDVHVPDGIEVVDNRLEAHGYSKQDGRVIEGTIKDSETNLPLVANVRLESIVPNPAGGYIYSAHKQTLADQHGYWSFKNVGHDWFRIVAEANGYAPRILTTIRYNKQPGWEKADRNLAKSATVKGRVTDTQGKPLSDVEVSMRDVAIPSQNAYESSVEQKVKSDEDGLFEIQTISGGAGRIWVHRKGYVRQGLGLTVTAPKSDVEIQMGQSASLLVRVLFDNRRKTGDYMVQIKPEGGEKIGSWGGSGNIDAENNIRFENVPPGRYILYGRPNPGSTSEQTKEMLVELEPGKDLIIELKAK